MDRTPKQKSSPEYANTSSYLKQRRDSARTRRRVSIMNAIDNNFELLEESNPDGLRFRQLENFVKRRSSLAMARRRESIIDVDVDILERAKEDNLKSRQFHNTDDNDTLTTASMNDESTSCSEFFSPRREGSVVVVRGNAQIFWTWGLGPVFEDDDAQIWKPMI